MLITIACPDCGARFRMGVSLLKGAKGVRVRCRKCGGKILVLRQEAPSDLSSDDVVPTDAEVPSAVGAELPRVTLSGPAPSPIGELTVPLSPVPVYDRRKAVAGKDTASARPTPKADGDLPPAPKVADPAQEIVPPVPKREVFSGGRSNTLKYFIIAGLSLLLLAGGSLYIGTTKPGQEWLGKFFPTYDIRDVKGSFEQQTASGRLFVIKGKVANFGKGPSGGIGIRVTLLGKDNQALAEKTAFAGNFLDEASLRKMDRSEIAGAMSNRFGEGNVNKEISPGKDLPFMVIFFDPPGEIEAVVVKAIDAR